MKKAIMEASRDTVPFDEEQLSDLKKKGYKFIQVKGFTIDKHYEYIEPQFLLLVPLKELPSSPENRDIYEEIESAIFEDWASNQNEFPKVLIAGHGFAE